MPVKSLVLDETLKLYETSLRTSTSVSVTKTSLRVTSSSTAPPSLSMKEDFGTGIDYSSGSWTWEERHDSEAYVLGCSVMMLLKHS